MAPFPPGTAVAREHITTHLQGAIAHRVRYASRDVNLVPTQASGLIIVPTVPRTNRPILTWCHGTTGLGDAACPSAQLDPARDLVSYFDLDSTASIDYGIPLVQSFLDDGWIVCATDYQGLGTPGTHHYTVNRSNARDALCLALAARAIDSSAGTVLAGVGWSQGGGAVAALAELDDEEYADLELSGIVSLSPGIPAMALATGAPSALRDSTVAPDAHLFMMLIGIQAANPEALALEELLTPLGIQIANATWNSQPIHQLDAVLARTFHLRGPILRTDPQNFHAWIDALMACSAGRSRPRCPVLVCHDLNNPPGREPCPMPWQEAYVARVRELGGQVEARRFEQDDHFSLPASAMPGAKAWLDGLLAG